MKKPKKPKAAPKAPKFFRWNTPVEQYAWDMAAGKHIPIVKSDKQIIGNLADPEYARAVSRILVELIELAEKQ